MKFQAPKGTRDFYPKEMAWRNFLFDTWRKVSIRNGFEEVDGPIYETLELYKVKSGEGIVSELFHFTDRGERELAIRPEFTPTLARMVAAEANSLPRPIKWFSLPNVIRAEKPQRGRLREHWQWNIDIIGVDQPVADAETIFVAVDLLAALGLNPDQIRVKISHRETTRHVLKKLGVPDERMVEAFTLLDRREKIADEEFRHEAAKLNLDDAYLERLDQICRMKYSAGGGLGSMKSALGDGADLDHLEALDAHLQGFDVASWCEYDMGIVRGLAYYTGTVFEIHEVTGAERAVAGGGRYDQLIELFGGPSMAAVGFGMGDVVLSNVLIDKGLMPEDVSPRPDVFLLAASDEAAAKMPALAAKLRHEGLHARFTYKNTRNVGKLLKDASAVRARFAVILGKELGENVVAVKNMESGEQTDINIADLADHVVKQPV